LELKVAEDGGSARLQVGALPRARKIVVHLHRWASDQPEAAMEFAAGKPVSTTIRLLR
jgi:hypothetical protein